MSEYEQKLEKRLEMMKKAREMNRRGPANTNKKQEQSAYSRRLGNFLNMWRNKRKRALREFDGK